MEVSMKKWIQLNFRMGAFFVLLLFAVFLPCSISAEEASNGILTVKDNHVDVALEIPGAKTEVITSLRVRLYVNADIGQIEKPIFTFSKTIQSTIKDAAIINDTKKDNSYYIDLILSGKKEQNLFETGDQITIGTLYLNSVLDGQEFKASVSIVGQTEDNKEPVVTYVNSVGQAEQTVILKVEPVTVSYIGKTDTPSTPTNPTTPVPSGPGGSIVPGNNDSSTKPEDSNTETPDKPTDTDSPDSTTKPSDPPGSDQNPETPGQPTVQEFDETKKPKLKASVKNGSKKVTLQWNQVDGADGYMIYQYQPKTGKYKRIKTISNPEKTKYSINLKYSSSYRFKIRTFKTQQDGSKVYGNMGAVLKVKTAPSKVKGVTFKVKSGTKGTLTWKKVPNADGYQIYYSKKKNKNGSLLKTIKKGTTTKYTKIKYKKGKTGYYKVRAFVKGTGKKRIYGKFSVKAVNK